MHLWIAATIAFCCVIVTEAQTKRPRPFGGFRDENLKSPKIKKLAEMAVVEINKHFDRTDLVLFGIQSARSQIVYGKRTVLVIEVIPDSCRKEMRTARCQQQQKTCEVSIWKKPQKKPEVQDFSCSP